ncbi:hypothetical protein ACTQ49_10465 [Luteococcus sp. Sow4_B9]
MSWTTLPRTLATPGGHWLPGPRDGGPGQVQIRQVVGQLDRGVG